MVARTTVKWANTSRLRVLPLPAYVVQRRMVFDSRSFIRTPESSDELHSFVCTQCRTGVYTRRPLSSLCDKQGAYCSPGDVRYLLIVQNRKEATSRSGASRVDRSRQIITEKMEPAGPPAAPRKIFSCKIQCQQKAQKNCEKRADADF